MPRSAGDIAIEINGPARDVEAGRPFLFRPHPSRYAGGHDPIGVGVEIDWTTDCAGAYGVFVAVEPHQARLRRRGFVVYETRRSDRDRR